MTLKVGEIRERVDDIDAKRAEYRRAAELWESMWRMQVFNRTAKQALEQDAQEQVTLPVTFNIVHVAQRLLGSDPRIQVPAETAQDDDDLAASKRQRWLNAVWQRNSRESRRNVIDDAKFLALVRGRFVFEVKWVRDVLPERMRDRRLPVRVRTLDPLNVGVREGPLYVEYAYHKDLQPVSSIRQMFPKLKLETKTSGRRTFQSDNEELDVIDFWWVEADGSIWNAVTVEDEFAKKPVRTDYPDIPIIEGYGDSAPLSAEEYRSLSILHPLKELYRYQCRLASQIGTGLLFYFWPAVLVTNDQGQEVPDIEIRPGTTTALPPGTRVDFARGDVNMPLANAMLQMVDTQMQQSTFPGVMFGESGAMQAGFGVNILADQARGRVNQFRENLETAIEHTNEILLGLVDELAQDQGVQVWGKGATGDIYHEVLRPADIRGAYQNLVTLLPGVTTDDVQKQTMGLRMVEMGITSKRTFREQIASQQFPEDEARRVAWEQALESDELKPKIALRAVQDYLGDDWQALIAGTSLEQLADQEAQKMQPEQPPVAPSNMPAGMPPGAMPPGMMPPEMMGQGGPPMGGEGMPPGMMPPEMMGQGGPPPGDPSLQLPGLLGGSGVPPEMQGMLTPEALGLPPGGPPGLYQELTGQAPLSPEEELRRLSGLPPEMMP